MRNILTVLTLCVLALTTSNVFAVQYDESKRTERMGLSFYDGRPMYLLTFSRPTGALLPSYPPGVSRLEAARLRSDVDISEFDGYRPNGGYVGSTEGTRSILIAYASDANDGEFVILEAGSSLANSKWVQELMARDLDSAIATARLGGGDLAVETYDNILPNAQDWARRGILLAAALLVISAGSNKFRELTSGETQATVKEEKKADATSSQEERATVRKIRESAKLGKLGGGLDERFLSESERREHDFITGKAFGLEFDDKVRASNKLFLDAFNRLPRYEQEALLQEWRVSSYTESYQGSVERRFIDWREGSGNDGATSRKQTDAFDNWFGSSDPFNDNDDEDGESPF